MNHKKTKRILIVAATDMESHSFRRIPGVAPDGNLFSFDGCLVDLLITGIGTVATAYSLTKRLLSDEKPDLAINIGIAGSFDPNFGVGEVVYTESDRFADLGIETNEGFAGLFETGLADPDKEPYRKGVIPCYSRIIPNIPGDIRPASAITVNTSSSLSETIKIMLNLYNPVIETMEGAAFFYICALENVPYLNLRSVSNMVGPRNTGSWDIPQALENLSIKLKDILQIIG